jgi:hypothetical protein
LNQKNEIEENEQEEEMWNSVFETEILLFRQNGILDIWKQCEVHFEDKDYQEEAQIITPFLCPISSGRV